MFIIRLVTILLVGLGIGALLAVGSAVSSSYRTVYCQQPVYTPLASGDAHIRCLSGVTIVMERK